MEKDNGIVYVVSHIHELHGLGEGIQDVEIVGVFSSREAAQEAVNKFYQAKNFYSSSARLHIAAYPLDKACWGEGFIPDYSLQFEQYYFAFYRCISIPETGYENWTEESHVISAASLAEAQIKAEARAHEQINEYENELGQRVLVHPAKVTQVPRFLNDETDKPVS